MFFLFCFEHRCQRCFRRVIFLRNWLLALSFGPVLVCPTHFSIDKIINCFLFFSVQVWEWMRSFFSEEAAWSLWRWLNMLSALRNDDIIPDPKTYSFVWHWQKVKLLVLTDGTVPGCVSTSPAACQSERLPAVPLLCWAFISATAMRLLLCNTVSVWGNCCCMSSVWEVLKKISVNCNGPICQGVPRRFWSSRKNILKSICASFNVS